MKLDHVGIVVSDMNKAVDFYQKAIGLVVSHKETVESQKVNVVFLKDPSETESYIELLEPASGDSVVAGFLNKRGPGVHHVAFQSPDIRKTFDAFPGKMVESAPRPGARSHKVCFLHPRHSDGVLLEFVSR